jgi:hypothetical protein
MEPRRDDQLAADLQALRPTPHPEFAAELDRQVAAGFPRRSRLPRLSFFRLHRPSRRVLLPVGGLAVIAIAVAGVLIATSEGQQEPSGAGTLGFLNAESPPADDPATTEPVESAAEGSAESAAGGESLSPRPFGHGQGRRAVERSADMTLGASPEDVADDAAQVFAAVHANRGIVLQSSVEEGSAGEAGANFELLIPSRNLGDALADFSAIDEVRSRQESTADITAPTVTTAELLRESRARVDSLLGQLERAETESEREAIEAELRQERRHRTRLRSDLHNLHQRAHMSGVSLQIETGAAEDSSSGGAWGVDDAFDDAGHVLAIAAAVAVVALAILGPIALIALIAWLTHRAWLRRGRRRVLS